MAFEKSPGWKRLQCVSRHTFGFASADAWGTVEVRCTDKLCRKDGYITVHLFNLANGESVTDYLPKGSARLECVPTSEQANQPDSRSA